MAWNAWHSALDEHGPRTPGHPPRKGRGAPGNRVGRYEAREPESLDDGWGSLDEAPAPLDCSQFRPPSPRGQMTLF